MHRSAIFISIFVGGALLLMMCYITIPAVTLAHSGGIDRYGCHRDKIAGNYHCHRGACAGKTFASQEEMLRSACAK
jgi:hypothetical protein